MATLNLRISGNKSKSSGGKYQKASSAFPSHAKTFYNQMRKELQNAQHSNEFITEITELFMKTNKKDDILSILKKIPQVQGMEGENEESITRLVIAIYLPSDPQCHTKNAALKLLELPSLRATTVQLLTTLLSDYLGCVEGLAEQGLAAGSMLHLARSQLLADMVVCQSWTCIIGFLTSAVTAHVNHLSLPNSDTPTQQQCVFSGLHSLCQTTVSCLQIASKAPSSPDVSVDTERALQSVLVTLLCHPPPQLPSDTQNTSAMALVLLSRRDSATQRQCWEKLQESSVGVKMSLCAALVTSLGPELSLPVPETLASTLCVNPGCSTLEAIFTFLVSNTGKSCESSLLLGGCRALSSLGRSLTQVPPTLRTSLLSPALDHCLTHLEHTMDSVRHAAKGMLEDVIAATSDSSDLELIVSGIRALPSDSKARFAGVSLLASRLGSARILIEFPGLVDWLLDGTQDYGTAPHACAALEVLMRYHIIPDVSAEEWCGVWVQPMLARMPSPNLEPALAKAVQLRPQTLPFILQVCKNQGGKSLHSSSRLKVLLSCLKMAQKCNMLTEEREGQWRGVLEWKTLNLAAHHAEDDIRLAAIALLIESRKSTEPLTEGELKVLAGALVCCGDSQSPATQHRATALVKKLLIRLNDSIRGLIRKRESMQFYLEFMNQLCIDAFSALFPGSGLGRRTLALNTLVLVLQLLAPQDPWCQTWESLQTKEHAQNLLDCLTDTYENNKALALTLINSFPVQPLEFDEVERVREILDWCMTLSESCKPPDSVTAAYMLSAVVDRDECLPALQFASQSSYRGRLAACTLLVQRLELQLNVARESILQAAAKGPMYGTLLCLRHLLSSVHLPSLAQQEEGAQWRSLVYKMVDTCFQLNAVVAPVVNSSSPEGHLPMDFSSDISSQLQGSLTLDDSQTIKVTAQMVLLCSWRTVKEVSLLLGELAAGAPATHKADYLLSNEQLISIGEHFTQLLCETKHRGAFEQAYVGFCRLCAWLWRVPSGELPQLPSRWLQELLAAVECEEDEVAAAPRLAGKLCATRRSAGVPFIVQALVTTELEVRDKPECFPGAMARLLQLARHSGPPQVHALNILRALFRSSQLGEHVAPYVAEGFCVAIQAFKGPSWAERNAATLLFSALMGRVFGVKHTPGHEDLPRKNRMTGRIFFRLYPSLFDLLSGELAEAARLINSQGVEAQLTPSLHPVLLLLARLYPSSLEGTDTSLNLLLLRDSVLTCAASPVLHTRELAARALIPLVDPSCVPTFIAELSLEPPHNRLHGTLLQLACLAQSTEAGCVMGDKLQAGLTLLSPPYSCEVIKTAFLRVVTATMNHHPTVINTDLAASLSQLTRSIVSQPGGIGYTVLKAQAAHVLLRLSTQDLPPLEQLLCDLLRHPLSEVNYEALLFLLAVVPARQGEISGDAAEYEFSKLRVRCNLGEQLRESRDVAQCLVNLAARWIVSEGQAVCIESRTALCLSLSRHAPAVLRADWSGVVPTSDAGAETPIHWLLGMEREQRLGLANHMLLACCGELICALDTQPSKQLMENYGDALLLSSGEDNSHAAHLVAAQSLCRTHKQLSSTSTRCTCIVFCVGMNLLRDSSEQVRGTAAQVWPWLATVTTTKAIENLAKFMQLSIDKSELQYALATLLHWALGDMITAEESFLESGEDLEHERVFDKGDVALSREELKLAAAACTAIKQVMMIGKRTKDDLLKALKSPLRWLPSGPPRPDQYNLLLVLLQVYTTAAEEPLPHFLHPDYQRIKLNYGLRLGMLEQTGIFQQVSV